LPKWSDCHGGDCRPPVLLEATRWGHFLQTSATPPIGPVERTSYTVTDGLGMSKGTKWPEAAWEVTRLISSPINQGIRMRTVVGRVAVRMSVMQPYKEAMRELEPATEHRNLDVVLEAFEMGHDRDDEHHLCQAQAEEIIHPLLVKAYIVGDSPVSVHADAWS
jgi:hypothetical protein